MLVCATAAPAQPDRRPDEFGGYSSSQIVVRLQPDAFAHPGLQNRIAALGRNADPRPALSAALQATAAQWRVTTMRPVFAEEFSDPALAAKYGLDRTYVIEVPAGSDTPRMAAAFAQLRGDIEFATVDTIGGVAELVPNDPSFVAQYAMKNTGQSVCSQSGTADADIDATDAWELHTGDLGTVTIAIIDSGVNSHTDYGINAPPYPNGRFVEGRNTNNPLTPTLTTDGCPHGTHVTGIATATGNNGIGVAGVTWGANIMPVRVLSGCGGFVGDLAEGIVWAADHGADIANMSLQYYNLTFDEYNNLQNAIDYANDLGMLLIAAAGNYPVGGSPPNRDYVAYPGRMPGCMAVSATDNRDLLASISRYGNEVDVCAPGRCIYSTWTNNNYTYLDGTSMATPHVSGVAALMKSYVPELTNVDLELLLVYTAEDKGDPGWDNQYGFGRVNAHQALLKAGVWRGILFSSPPDGAIDARKPIDPDGSNLYGWQAIDATFDRNSFVLGADDFSVSQKGGVSVAPVINQVAAVDDSTVTVTLESIIEPTAWTTITHHALDNPPPDFATSVRLGYLPGDSNADGVSNEDDIVALILMLDGAASLGAMWSTDIDRSELFTPADVLEVADLLNGAGAYEPYLNTALP